MAGLVNTSDLKLGKMTPEQACNQIGWLTAGIVDKLLGLSRRINALNRAAGILKDAATRYRIPDLNGLIPARQITIDTYRALQRACPQLNLPNINNVPDLNALMGIVALAYAALSRMLDLSPLGMLGVLEGILQNKIKEVLDSFADQKGYLQCLCDAKNLVDHIPDWDSQKAKSLEVYRYVTGQGAEGKPTLLSDNLTSKLADLKNAQSTLKQLGEVQQGEVGSKTSSGQSNDVLSQKSREFFT